MRYTAVLFLLLFISLRAAAQGYVTDGENKGGMYPYVNGGTAINEATAGIQGGLGIKTYGKDFAPLGGQVELAYMNTGMKINDTITTNSSFLNFSFMGAVTTFRKLYNYHVAIGPSVMFNVGSNSTSTLYNFYPRLEGGIGYGKFLLKAGANFSLNGGYSNLYSFTLNFYPTRKKTWAADEGH